jgi:PAS domain S-box-containing protein
MEYKTGPDKNFGVKALHAALVIIAIWTIIVGGSLAWNIYNTEQQTLALATNAAHANFNKDKAFRLWATGHGGVYVPPTLRTPPNPHLKHIPDRDIQTSSGIKLTLMNPAYMLRQMMDEYSDLYGIRGRITSQKPLNPNNAPDEWEKAALIAFEKDQLDEVVSITQKNGEPVLRLIQPMIVKKGCLKCHGHQGYEVGDVRGGIGISVPLAPYHVIEQKAVVAMLWSHSAFWVLGIVGVGFYSRRLHQRQLERKNAEQKTKQEQQFSNKIEAELLAEQNLTKDSIEAISDTFFLFNPATGKALRWNRIFSDVSGYNDDEISNLKAPESYYSQSDLAKAAESIGNVAKFGKATVELSLICKNGGQIPFEYSVSQMQTKHGSMLISIGRDISERKKMEMMLKNERDFADNLVNTAQTIILVLDKKGRIVRFNSYMEELSGFCLDEVQGKDWFTTFLPNQDTDKMRALFQIAVDDIQTMGNINPIVTKDGRVVDIEWYDKTLKDAFGCVTGLLAIGYDVTQRRELEIEKQLALENAEAANQAKSEFLAVMSHEMRTPLNAILGMAEVVKENNNDSEQSTYLAVIQRSGNNLLTLIEDILDLSHIEAGRLVLEQKSVNLQELTVEAVEIHAHNANVRGLDLNYQIDSQAPNQFSGDKKRLRQVLLNLIGNAVKFTNQGMVELQVSCPDPQTLQFSVSDSGIGISNDKQKLIFDPFSQGDSSNTRKHGGVGLGLAICKRLISAMNGQIWVESETNKGSTFHFSIPLSVDS